MRHGAFGHGLGQMFKQRNPPALLSSVAGGPVLAATEVWFDGPGYEKARADDLHASLSNRKQTGGYARTILPQAPRSLQRGGS